jgi:hypothetical protein
MSLCSRFESVLLTLATVRILRAKLGRGQKLHIGVVQSESWKCGQIGKWERVALHHLIAIYGSGCDLLLLVQYCLNLPIS